MKIIIIDQVSKLLIKSLEKNNIAYDIKDQTTKDEIQKTCDSITFVMNMATAWHLKHGNPLIIGALLNLSILLYGGLRTTFAVLK